MPDGVLELPGLGDQVVGAQEVDELEQRGIGTIGCYVVEGIRDAQNEKLD